MTSPLPKTGAKEHSWAIIPHPGADKTARLERAIEHSLELQKAESHFLPLVGRVIVLIGTSSVGKSSIIAAMRAQDADIQETGADLVVLESAYNHFQKNHSAELAFLQSVLKPKPHQTHIHYAVGGGIFDFKDSVSEGDKSKARELAALLKKSLQTIPKLTTEEFEFTILDRAMQLSLGGKPCAFDLINVDTVAKHALGKMPKKVALIYCPLDVYVSRIQNRNRKAIEEKNPGELRLEVFHLQQMSEVFRPVENDNEKVLFSITRDQLIENFDKLFEDWTMLGDEDVSSRRGEELAKTLEAFGFTDPSITSLDYTPRFKGYDAIIDTSATDSSGAARIIRE